MKAYIYDFTDYIELLDFLINSSNNKGRGIKKQLSDVLNCQLSFITHVFNRNKDFSSEHIFKIATFFKLNNDETEFLVTLHSFNRAGTQDLKSFYLKKLNLIKNKYKLLKHRLNEVEPIDLESQAIYYSHWLYSAIHMAVTIPDLQNIKNLKKYFDLEAKEFNKIVNFLIKKDLIKKENDRLLPGVSNIFLSKDSPLINSHHTNWKIKIINDFAKKEDLNDLSYTLCFTASEEDYKKIRELLLNTINDALKIIRPSPEEKLCLFALDLKGI